MATASFKNYMIMYELESDSDLYTKIRYDGVNAINSESSFILKHFMPNISDEEQKNYVYENQIFNEMVNLVRESFQKWYNFDCTNIFVNNNYRNSFSSYEYSDRINQPFVHIDQLLESIALGFMLNTLKWAKEFENDKNEYKYFIYLIFLLNECCIFGQLPGEDAKSVLMEKVYKDQQIMNLAADCYWSIMLFNTAHEFAHIYQAYTNPNYWEKKENCKESESNADAIAYDILLRLIMDKQEKNLVVEKYTYLAPMMYMDLFNLYYYTDYILYGIKHEDNTHPTPDKRKEALFNIANREIYQFDTEEGNIVYQNFCWIYDIFVERLPKYKESGKLNEIIHNDLR